MVAQAKRIYILMNKVSKYMKFSFLIVEFPKRNKIACFNCGSVGDFEKTVETLSFQLMFSHYFSFSQTFPCFLLLK